MEAEDPYRSCKLCPRRCGVNRRAGQRGRCGADATMHVARAALHFWEEPPLSGSAGSGAVFFSHCPLRCVFCQNFEISTGGSGLQVTRERLIDIFFELKEQGALNINLVTGTHYAPDIDSAISEARSRGFDLPFVWNTSGYETLETLEMLANAIDIYLPDFKYADAETARRYSFAPDYPAITLAAIEFMLAQQPEIECREDGTMESGVIIRHMIMPGELENSFRVLDHVKSRFGTDVGLSIMNQYTPLIAESAQQGSAAAQSVLKTSPNLSQRVSEEDYERVLDYADSIGFDDYFWQEGEANRESFVPAFDFEGVLPKSGN